MGFAWIPSIAQAQSFDTTRTTVPKSVHVASIFYMYQQVQYTYAKDDFETRQQYRDRMAAIPLDPHLRVAVISPPGYAYDAGEGVLSIPLHPMQSSQGWFGIPAYGVPDELGLPVEYGLSVPAESEFGHLLAAGDSSGIKLPVDPQTAEAMRSKRMDCLLVFRLVPGEDSAPLWEKRDLKPEWDGGPEMYTWRYLCADVVALWLFDAEKKRPVLHKFQFHPSSSSN